MPKKYLGLTDEEKNIIKAKNEEYLTKYNNFFNETGLVLLNKNVVNNQLEDKLNNEEMVARYRIAQEIKELNAKYKVAYNEASVGIKMPENDKDYLASSIMFLLKVDGSPESKEYNKSLLESYAKNPVEFTHNRIKYAMNYNPQALIEAGNDKVKLMEFYRDNMALCHEANRFGDIFGIKSLGVPPELQEAKESMKGLIQKINYSGTLIKECEEVEFFALPELDKDKADLVMRNSKKVFGFKLPQTITSILSRQRGDKDNDLSLADYCKKLEEKGLKIDKNIFLKYKCVHTDPETGKKKEVSLMDFISNKPNVEVVERSKDEILKLNEVSKAFQNRYSLEFQKRMSEKLGKPYNIFNVEKEMAGGLFARVFRKPSQEFQNYMQALKDYTNPEKEGYLNKDNLREAGEQYLHHVNQSGKNLEDMDELRQIRTNLVLNTMSVVSEMQQDDVKIRGQINASINSLLPNDLGIPKENAVNENELEDFELVEKNNNLDLDLDLEEEKDLNQSI